MRLASLQAEFAAAVTGGDEAPVMARVAGDPALARRRLAIYRDAIDAARRRALRSAFPVVARLVGDAFFGEAARLLAPSHPPASADLNRYGEAFPAFLAAYPHASGMPWLADVARLEWARHESLLAADAPALDFASLALLPEERQPAIRFDLHPAVRLVRSAWPVLAIWEANQPDRDGTPDRDEGADDVLAWREGGSVRLERLSRAQAAFVEGLARGLPLGEAVTDDLDFAPLLARLAARGLLAGYRLAGPPGA